MTRACEWQESNGAGGFAAEETFVVEGRRHRLSGCLKDFSNDPFPTFTYQADGLEIEKRILMPYGETTTVIEYELHGLDRDPVPECFLELQPLAAFPLHIAHDLTYVGDGVLVASLHRRTTATLIASTRAHCAADARALRQQASLAIACCSGVCERAPLPHGRGSVCAA